MPLRALVAPETAHSLHITKIFCIFLVKDNCPRKQAFAGCGPHRELPWGSEAGQLMFCIAMKPGWKRKEA